MNNIWIDENGKSWLTGENGKLLKDENGNMIPPTRSQKISRDDEFTIYDSSGGHCPLCGSLYCRSNCFK